jgi:MFS family permease
LLVVITALGTMLAALNSSMIAAALPDISRALGVGPRQAGWLVTSYLIVMAVTQPIAGSLGDLFGRRRIFLGALSGFANAGGSGGSR